MSIRRCSTRRAALSRTAYAAMHDELHGQQQDPGPAGQQRALGRRDDVRQARRHRHRDAFHGGLEALVELADANPEAGGPLEGQQFEARQRAPGELRSLGRGRRACPEPLARREEGPVGLEALARDLAIEHLGVVPPERIGGIVDPEDRDDNHGRGKSRVDPARQANPVADRQPLRHGDVLGDRDGDGGCVGRRLLHRDGDRPGPGDERGMVLDALGEPELHELRPRTSLREGTPSEGVRASRPQDRPADVAERALQLGRDDAVGGPGGFRVEAHRDLDVRLGHRRIGHDALQTGDGHGTRVHRAGGEQARGEEADQPGRRDDRPRGPGAAEAHLDHGDERRHQGTVSGGSRRRAAERGRVYGRSPVSTDVHAAPRRSSAAR